jgi:5'-deoxynucleotidase YfbR-like HD superfamily hydrolase
MQKQISDENAKYAAEHDECDLFYQNIVEEEQTKFDALYQIWKESVVRFHKIKQNDAIKRFVDRLNSKEFVNPQTRVDIFNNMKAEQQQLFE